MNGYYSADDFLNPANEKKMKEREKQKEYRQTKIQRK